MLHSPHDMPQLSDRPPQSPLVLLVELRLRGLAAASVGAAPAAATPDRDLVHPPAAGLFPLATGRHLLLDPERHLEPALLDADGLQVSSGEAASEHGLRVRRDVGLQGGQAAQYVAGTKQVFQVGQYFSLNIRKAKIQTSLARPANSRPRKLAT